MTWGLRITFCDVRRNEFLELGGAAWPTKKQRDANLMSIPAAKRETPYILDVMSARGIEGDRFIDAATVEKLTGKRTRTLIAEAREKAKAEGSKHETARH